MHYREIDAVVEYYITRGYNEVEPVPLRDRQYAVERGFRLNERYLPHARVLEARPG